MELNEITSKQAPVELTFNVINSVTGKKVNENPLTESDARELAKQLQESEGASLIVRSNRATLME
jgi:hypothetical protein